VPLKRPRTLSWTIKIGWCRSGEQESCRDYTASIGDRFVPATVLGQGIGRVEFQLNAITPSVVDVHIRQRPIRDPGRITASAQTTLPRLRISNEFESPQGAAARTPGLTFRAGLFELLWRIRNHKSVSRGDVMRTQVQLFRSSRDDHCSRLGSSPQGAACFRRSTARRRASATTRHRHGHERDRRHLVRGARACSPGA
jgi:hypothetical protein